MSDPDPSKPLAWQPLTPSGIAAFGSARLGRLLVVQFIIALVATGVIVWFLHRAWFPVITESISRLPPQSEIRNGRLDWQGDSPMVLAEGRFLAISVDLRHQGNTHSPADVQVELGLADIRLFSLFGFLPATYPRGESISLDPADAGPWWGAWAPPILWMVAGGSIAALLAAWALLATLYALPTWLITFFANRNLSLAGSWRLAGAALMPGALFLTAALVLYGLGVIELIGLLAAAAVHLVLGWVCLFAGAFKTPRPCAVAGQKANPFTGVRQNSG
jgi:hypothetical protein